MRDRLVAVRFVTALAIGALVTFVGVGCGDDDKVQQDAAPQQDHPVQDDVLVQHDVQTDVQDDAGPKISGTVGIYDVTVVNPPIPGQGIAVSLGFVDDYAATPYSLQEVPGQPVGCKVQEYTPDSPDWEDVSLNEGSFQLKFLNADGSDGTPVAPPCIYNDTLQDYICPWGQGVGATWSTGPQAGTKVITLTNTGTEIPALAVGSTVVVQNVGAGALNAGKFPIVAHAGVANTFVVADLTGAATNGAETGMWMVLFGKMPSPTFTAEPGMMADDQKLQVIFTPGGGNHVAAFDEIVTPYVGGHFTIHATDNTATPPIKDVTDIPFDGSAFKVECDTTNDGCGTALGVILSITGTNGDLTGAGPLDMPDGTKRVYLRCSQFSTGSITVPAAYSDYLKDMTRLEVYYLRLVPKLLTALNVNIVAGHGRIAYVTK